MPGSLTDFVKYDEENPGVVTSVMNGIRAGRLKLCPILSTNTEANRMEKKLRQLFAERRFEDHFAKFLHPSIPSTSRNINCDEIQTLTDALRDGWVRSSPSEIGLCGKADAMRVSMSTF
jgi:hypothetical protein